MKRLIWKLILIDETVIYSNVLNIEENFIEYKNIGSIRDARSSSKEGKSFSQFKSVSPTDPAYAIEPSILKFLKEHKLYKN